jgi:RNA polymerase sigma-70 factor, ECF subfamily
MHVAAKSEQVNHDALADCDLVALARQGDETAIRHLIKRHNQRLFRIARGIVRDDTEAEDIVQETYVRAFTSLGSFRGEAQFSTWLSRIALNEALGRIRQRRPLADLSELETDGTGAQLIMFPSSQLPASPETETARAQIRVLLEQAVDHLPDIFRIVFILRDVEGLSVEETASQLAIKPDTVKTRLHRARKLMRAAIEERLSLAFAELFPFDGQRCASMADRVVEQLRNASAAG